MSEEKNENTEIENKSENKIENEKEKINLLYYEEKIGRGNFGDELSIFITRRLLNKKKYELVLNQKGIKKNLICIGSYLHAAKNHYYIYGTGVRTKPPVEGALGFKKLNVCAVRGPVTYNFLTKDKEIDCPVVYGDPALLLKMFYRPYLHQKFFNKIALIPHKSNYEKYLEEDKYDKEKFLLIDPRENWQKVVDNLCSCKAVVSASLHGLVIADTYDKPNVMLKEFELSEGEVKFKDYCYSQKRKYYYIRKLEDYDEDKLYTEGNKINLEKLKNAFPFR